MDFDITISVAANFPGIFFEPASCLLKTAKLLPRLNEASLEFGGGDGEVGKDEGGDDEDDQGRVPGRRHHVRRLRDSLQER